MNASTFYGLRKAQEKTTACDIPSRSEDSDLSDSDDDYPPANKVARDLAFRPHMAAANALGPRPMSMTAAVGTATSTAVSSASTASAYHWPLHPAAVQPSYAPVSLHLAIGRSLAAAQHTTGRRREIAHADQLTVYHEPQLDMPPMEAATVRPRDGATVGAIIIIMRTDSGDGGEKGHAYPKSDQEGLLVKTSNSRFKPKKHGDRLPQCPPTTSDLTKSATGQNLMRTDKDIKGNATLFSPKAKQACGAKYGNLDDTLLTWFKQACAAGINFDGSILHEKAMEIANRLGITDFTVSNGWIDHFRKRHGIAYKTPSKSSSLKGEACHGGKCSNDRLTVLLYYNVDKLKPWVIGKYRNPRYFKNTRLLPCHYSSNCPWTAVNASTAQHCFERCGVHMDGYVETAIKAEELEAASCEQEPTEAMNALGATGVTYDDLVTVDAAVVTSECQSIAEIVVNSVASEAVDCVDDDEHEPRDSGELAVELADPRFGETVAALDLVHRHVAQQSNADSNAAFQKRNASVYDNIVEALRQAAYVRTRQQVQHKIENLSQTYR
ncbi:hypothetical protein HPB52_012244 [Rhipicephalus sanguineus]|uniref:HTH CENPB-type domain-containing protein n=1 Tax=Rhipicephalus sanguineus TaxID=34632 RepID=A0A9D4Q295_RHISA|nr:hypothetical protein HPB52_012244 [Rhipicephalus sanguineus]